jgi:DNA polymerase
LQRGPRKTEQELKKPLVGRSGKFYEEKILVGIGLLRENVYTTNTVLCRTDDKNRNPLPTEIELCRNFLDAQICLIDPVLLVTLGNIPLYGTCEITGITKLHGNIIKSRIWSNGKSYSVFPMFHPSYVLRGNGMKEITEDIEKLRIIIEEMKNKG